MIRTVLLTMKQRLHEMFCSNTRYQTIMLVFCILFGLAMIANTQVAGDGAWYWYAVLFREGKHLYSGLHLALQPMYVLETSWFMGLAGKGWMVLKLPAVLHLVAYCLGLLLVMRHSGLSDQRKALVLGCAFFVSISFEAYRFDDYHVLADCCEVYSILLLMLLQKADGRWRGPWLVAALGMLSGIAMTTRLNDGGALALGVAIALVCLAPSRRLLSVLLFGAVAALTVLLVVRLTGDTFRDYAMYSIFKAAGSKGGAGNVLAYPLALPMNTLIWLTVFSHSGPVLYTLAVAFAWGFLVEPVTRQSERLKGRKIFVRAAIGVIFILLLLYRKETAFLKGDFIVSLAGVGTLAAYSIGIIVLFRWFNSKFLTKRDEEWTPREILFLIPLGQLASSSMSSGGHHQGLYGPIAIMILMLPVALPFKLKNESHASAMLAVVALLLCCGAVSRTLNPFSWHSYRSQPMFQGRELYRHPVYGPMLIDRQQLELFERICSQVKTSRRAELLSLPYPYANYFCSVPPWHDYVQTFFDTSSKETIFALMQELQHAPPQWIVYQRQLDNMALHEAIFNAGKPIPHRYLDTLIEQKIASGEWQVTYTSDYGNWPDYGYGDQWLLIRTLTKEVTTK